MEFASSRTALAQIARLAQVLARADNLELLLAELLDSALHLSHAQAGRIYVLDETSSHLKVAVSQNLRRAQQPEPPNLSIKTDSFDAPVPVYAATFGQSVNIRDLAGGHGYNIDYLEYPLCHSAAEETESETNDYYLRNLIAFPLLTPQQQTIGVLELFNCEMMADLPDTRESNDDQTPLGFSSIVESTITQLCTIAMAVTNTVLSRELLTDQNKQLKREVELAKVELIVGETNAMQQAVQLAEMVAPQQLNVLIMGETGVGKDVLARYIHRLSSRNERPFIVQNCAALPADLLEAELFGYRKGAFTGAQKDHAGLFETANGGTLLLDEIGDMPIALQAKLLRVLQEGMIKPLGSNTEQPVNVRVLAATHQDLNEKIANKTFRADLYHRLNGLPIHLPPLRDRKQDLRQLVRHLAAHIEQNHNLPAVSKIEPSAWQALHIYEFPGNIRELRSIIERIMLLTQGGVVSAEIVQQAIDPQQTNGNSQKAVTDISSEISAASGNAQLQKLQEYGLKAVLEQFEQEQIQAALYHSEGKTKAAAQILNIPVRTLRDRRTKFGV